MARRVSVKDGSVAGVREKEDVVLKGDMRRSE